MSEQYIEVSWPDVSDYLIGSQDERQGHYKDWLLSLLRKHNCTTVLDSACGTGMDSVMLVENGFKVTSIDANERCLLNPMRIRWKRRNESGFNDWVIEEGNWLTLQEDLENVEGRPKEGYDALINLGNSFPLILQDEDGSNTTQLKAMKNLLDVIKPGGLMIIDMRNYALYQRMSNHLPSIYYDSQKSGKTISVKYSFLYYNGKPIQMILDGYFRIPELLRKLNLNNGTNLKTCHDRAIFYPYDLDEFTELLKQVMGPNDTHHIYGDYKELKEAENPEYYVHVVKKAT